MFLWDYCVRVSEYVCGRMCMCVFVRLFGICGCLYIGIVLVWMCGSVFIYVDMFVRACVFVENMCVSLCVCERV